MEEEKPKATTVEQALAEGLRVVHTADEDEVTKALAYGLAVISPWKPPKLST